MIHWRGRGVKPSFFENFLNTLPGWVRVNSPIFFLDALMSHHVTLTHNLLSSRYRRPPQQWPHQGADMLLLKLVHNNTRHSWINFMQSENKQWKQFASTQFYFLLTFESNEDTEENNPKRIWASFYWQLNPWIYANGLWVPPLFITPIETDCGLVVWALLDRNISSCSTAEPHVLLMKNLQRKTSFKM